jgi:gliding motility-associated-like protein
MIIVSVLGTMNAIAQNCDVDFPGTAIRNFSATCGGSSVANLTLGKDINMANGDVYIFNAPAVINIFGNFAVDAQGSGKIIIPAGVTVNVYGNLKLDPKNSGCRSSNPCTFEIEVQGTLNLLDDVDNSLVNLIWSGAGAVNVVDNFKNSSNGCMACDAGGCPDFDVKPGECDDDGVGCTDSDFCATILNGCSNDNTDPIITSCPGNQIVNMTGPGCTQIVTWPAPGATDNCSWTSLTPNHLPGSIFPKGTTVVTYTAKDASGNTSICSFNVTVVDYVAPSITACSSDITVNANASCQAVVNWDPPIYSDNCLGTVLSSTKPSGSTFDKGTTVVTYTATDVAGNTATCSFNVNVVDNSPPIISGCPANKTVSANSSCQAVVSWPAPTVSDNCSAATLVVDKPPGSVFEVGTTKVTYTATIPSGESAICSFDVIVVDNSPPQVVAIGTTTATVGSDCRTNVNWSTPNILDCNDFQIESTHQPGDEFDFGTTQVTYSLTDALGNSSDYSFQVVVRNQNPPVILNCPADISVEADEHGFAAVDWAEPTASVVCGELSFTSSHSSGQRFPIGTSQVVYTASDELKNESICSFSVVVSPPKIIINIINVVTPDGNGINDFLKVENIEKYNDNGIVIVDRWGSTIFKANGYDNDKVVWRGTNSSGGIVPTGTYFFTMSIRYGTETVKRSGFIELIR